MIKVVLVCNAGMSTSLLADRMEAAGNGEFEVSAYGESEYLQHLTGVSCILVGPQVRYLIGNIQRDTGGALPVESVDPRLYGTMNGAKVLDQVKRMIGLQ